jgi:hypothetical protein
MKISKSLLKRPLKQTAVAAADCSSASVGCYIPASERLLAAELRRFLLKQRCFRRGVYPSY